MSVPAYRRTESELRVLTAAEILMKMVVSATKHELFVSKKNFSRVAEPLLDSTRNTLRYITAANNYNGKDASESLRRIEMQDKAFQCLNFMVADVKICIEFASDKFSNDLVGILQQITTCKSMLKAWMKSAQTGMRP